MDLIVKLISKLISKSINESRLSPFFFVFGLNVHEQLLMNNLFICSGLARLLNK